MVDESTKNEVAAAEFRAKVDEALLHAVAAEPITANTKEIYKALAYVARRTLAERWVKTQVGRPQEANAPRLLHVDGIPDRAHAGQRPVGACAA